MPRRGGKACLSANGSPAGFSAASPTRATISTWAVTLARAIWAVLNGFLGDALIGELISVGVAISVAAALYAKTVLAMRIPEARQIEALVVGRLRGTAH